MSTLNQYLHVLFHFILFFNFYKKIQFSKKSSRRIAHTHQYMVRHDMNFFFIYSLACSFNWSSSLFMFFYSVIHGVLCVFVWNGQIETFGEIVWTHLYICVSVVSLIVNCLCSIKKKYFNWNESSFGHLFLFILKWTMNKRVQCTCKVNNRNVESSKNYSEKKLKKINFIHEIISNYYDYYEIFNERFR